MGTYKNKLIILSIPVKKIYRVERALPGESARFPGSTDSAERYPLERAQVRVLPSGKAGFGPFFRLFSKVPRPAESA